MGLVLKKFEKVFALVPKSGFSVSGRLYNLSMDIDDRSTEELADAIEQLHGIQTAAHQRMLEFVAVYDEREAWIADGSMSMASWLSYRFGLSLEQAREWVRVARALKELPVVREAFSEGRLGFELVALLTRVATKDDEGELLERISKLSAAQARVLVRGMRSISTADANKTHSERSLSMFWDEDKRMLRLRGRIPDADGLMIQKALERVAEKIPVNEDTGLYESYERRCADALVELASTDLAQEADAHRATIVVHVNVDTLAEGEGTGQLEDAPAIAAETARRLACDSLTEISFDGPDGKPLGIGRKSRQVPPRLYRHLRKRDQGCRFPGCGRTRWVQAHHMDPWAQGGATDSDNLIILCVRHHRLTHEGGWKIEGLPDEELRFIRPSGGVLKTGPPPVRPEIRARLPVLFGEETLTDWNAGAAQVSLDVPDRQFAKVE